ncbi:EAL domain-containing protein [Deinococcus altitudinis]|uniref:EAL domain-containing protein n=1 Tax=Deinococcus altitudinis TaxID=468914 RepID=UPI0038912997
MKPTVPSCDFCRTPSEFKLEIATAFQPIVNVTTREIYAYEALVRGSEGQSAAWVFEHVSEADHYHFDQKCRVTAIETAARLELQTRLSINFLPNAVYEPHNCIRATLRAAQETGFPLKNLIFEVTEHERVTDQAHIRRIIQAYKSFGFTTALDDYGAGHANAQLLLDIRPDIVKLDLKLIRGVDTDPWRQALIRSYVGFAEATRTLVVAEGIETLEEASILLGLGVTHMQGYFFARPMFQALPEIPDSLFEAVHASWNSSLN